MTLLWWLRRFGASVIAPGHRNKHALHPTDRLQQAQWKPVQRTSPGSTGVAIDGLGTEVSQSPSPRNNKWPQFLFGDVFALHPLRSIDPVCGALVELSGARCNLTVNGRTYLFCSEHCLAEFELNVAAYIGASVGNTGISLRVLREPRNYKILSKPQTAHRPGWRG